MNTNIRLAEERDTMVLAVLSHQLGYPASPEEMEERLRKISKQAGQAVFVAEQNVKVLGWLHVQTRNSLESPEYAEIVGMVVDEATRGEGIGAALVQAAEAWSVQHGVRALRVRSNVTRERTHDFYLKRGFSVTKSQKVFVKDLRTTSNQRIRPTRIMAGKPRIARGQSVR